jgi:formate-dependent nitrite reductase membrane component NrfD
MSARQEVVPEAEFESYYGRQILKTPTWKSPDVPLYLFLGGMAGASAVLAEGAAVTGRPGLERVARLAAAGGATAGSVALVHDLGRPERFLNMLRVLKPTSPLSVGSFILAPFSTLAGAAAASHVTGRLPRIGRLSGLGAAALGPPLATYTAALLANTAVPAWHDAHRELPFLFGGSGAAAAGGLGMLCARSPVRSWRPRRPRP